MQSQNNDNDAYMINYGFFCYFPKIQVDKKKTIYD